MKIPVLTYHSTNISGNEYYNNDHIALEIDLQLLIKLGIKIITAYQLIEWIKGDLILDENEKYTVLTFDDGCELDYFDWKHPSFGMQKSFYTIMKSFPKEIHAISFVIASPKDRKTLEKTCLAGHMIWGDAWWKLAEESKFISIENHSWDHLHKTIDQVQQKDNLKGDFSVIENLEDANKQIQQSNFYINSIVLSKDCELFAYPYGDYNDYLVNTFFPFEQTEIKAAFSCDAQYVTQNTNVWKIPRFVCGQDWNNKEKFIKLFV